MTNPTTITRRDYMQSIRDGEPPEALPLDQLEADPRAASFDLRRADLNGDDIIDGLAERGALFNLLDVSDGTIDLRITSTNRKGEVTSTGLAAAAAGIDKEQVVDEQTVVVVGLTAASLQEAQALSKQTSVLYISDAASLPTPDTVFLKDGTPLDLARSVDRRRFVADLGLSQASERDVLAVLDQAAPRARRELAELARVFAPGERGEAIPKRLVISAHGDGSSFFETSDERIRDTELIALAKALPQGAAQIHSIHLAACQHGFEPRMAAFREAFPNLQSAWGYAGFSPSGRAAQRHEQAWERLTHSLRPGGAGLTRESVKGSHRGENVAIWTGVRGYQVDHPARELRFPWSEVQRDAPTFQSYFRGETLSTDPMHGFLAEHYQRLQEVIGHTDFAEQSATAQARFLHERDLCLRLRRFDDVTRCFATAHRALIQSGYRALGISAPDFARMNRKEALDAVASFERELANRTPAPQETRRLWTELSLGLRDLDAAHIPLEWT